jgi:fatty-acyl-CoA synthase
LLKRYLEKGVRIFQGYACTESGGFATMSYWPLAFEKPHLCGPTSQNIDLIIADDELAEVEPGTVGEILVRGPQIFSGYWRKPQETEDSFFNGWFRTGDMGRLDEHGNLEVVDRKKNMIISGGVNIYPAEIERAMSAMLPGSELAVFGVEDQRWGERVVAIIVSDDEMNLSGLKAECKALLGDYKCPREFILSPVALPRTATGKVSRKELLDYYDRYQPQTAAEA